MRALLACVFVVAIASAVAASPKTSRGVTADGRTVVSRYQTSPPWAADIVRAPKPQLLAAERAKKQGGEGFYRVLLDVDTGRVRDVIVRESAGSAALDKSIVRALRQWRLRPRKWKEFEIHVALHTNPKA